MDELEAEQKVMKGSQSEVGVGSGDTSVEVGNAKQLVQQRGAGIPFTQPKAGASSY